jgi:hypothetical protein
MSSTSNNLRHRIIKKKGEKISQEQCIVPSHMEFEEILLSVNDFSETKCFESLDNKKKQQYTYSDGYTATFGPDW